MRKTLKGPKANSKGLEGGGFKRKYQPRGRERALDKNKEIKGENERGGNDHSSLRDTKPIKRGETPKRGPRRNRSEKGEERDFQIQEAAEKRERTQSKKRKGSHSWNESNRRHKN